VPSLLPLYYFHFQLIAIYAIEYYAIHCLLLCQPRHITPLHLYVITISHYQITIIDIIIITLYYYMIHIILFSVINIIGHGQLIQLYINIIIIAQ